MTTTAIQKICLVCMDRTGSNMISSRLDTHPNLIFYNEVFHRQYIIFHDQRVAANADQIAARDRDPASFISRLWSGSYEPAETRGSIRGIGFKLFLNHNADALRHVINSDAKIIFLQRRNPLARYSSFRIAAVTGEWKTKNAAKGKTQNVPFRADEFRSYVQNYLSLETLFKMTLTRWGREHFSFFYEDFMASPQVWDDLVAYLGFSPENFSQSPLVKQNSKDILKRFNNPDDVRKFVAAVGHYEWLTE